MRRAMKLKFAPHKGCKKTCQEREQERELERNLAQLQIYILANSKKLPLNDHHRNIFFQTKQRILTNPILNKKEYQPIKKLVENLDSTESSTEKLKEYL